MLANDAWLRLYGYTIDEVRGQTTRVIRSPHSTPEMYGYMWSRISDPARLNRCLLEDAFPSELCRNRVGVPGSVNPWYVMILLFVVLLSVGEAFYSPRLYEYTAAIAPKGQEASYMAMSSLPFFLAKLQGTFLQLLPKPLLTVDQVRILETNNVVSEEAKRAHHTLEGLGIKPIAVGTRVEEGFRVRRRLNPGDAGGARAAGVAHQRAGNREARLGRTRG